MATVTMTAANHDELVAAGGILLIDFWAEWCPPCRMFGPVFEGASEAHPDMVFAKVDTDSETALQRMYGASSIPTLVIYRDGIPVFGQAGALPTAALENLINQVAALDMDAVRTQYEAQLAAQQGGRA